VSGLISANRASRLGRLFIGIALLFALLLVVEPARSQPTPTEREKQIAELEKQIAELKAKLADLHKDDPKAANKKVLTLDNLGVWNTIRGVTLSPDGQWFAYTVASSENETMVVVRETKSDKEMGFPAGKNGGGSITFSDDNHWFVFSSTSKGETENSSVILLDLKTGDKQTFEGIRRTASSGDSPSWLALHRAPDTSMERRTESAPAHRGTDLILRELATGQELVLGNVSEFGFDRKGQRLALVIDAANQIGNGLQLRDMTTGVLTALETGKGTYQQLRWSEDGTGFTVLKGVEDSEHAGKRYSLLAFTDLDAKTPRKILYDPTRDPTFPKDMTIAGKRAAIWREDHAAITFGIQELKKKEPTRETPKAGPKDKNEKPDLVLWHWQDERLQSQQQVQASQDRDLHFPAIYHIADNKFIRIGDEQLKDVILPAKGTHALGLDRKPYLLQAALDGKGFQDVHAIDLKTGERKLLLKKNRWWSGLSPDGTKLLYYEDGQYHVAEMATGKKTVITKDVPTSFIDVEDDHNVDRPPTPALGWTRDCNAVLLSDGWDLWLVPSTGGPGTNLTVNGKKDGIRYRTRYQLDRNEKGIDFTQPQYFHALAEWTRQAGIFRCDDGKPALTKLLWADAEFGNLHKAQKADVFVYTRETVKDFPDCFAVDADFKEPRRLTDVNPIQAQFAWCPGTQLVEYKGIKGEKLQGLLLLPAGYEKGKSYPTIVFVYEKLTDRRNRYLMPTLPSAGFNPALYTSAGYAVLMPDITYLVNDPGISALTNVLAALTAAEKAGVVDPNRVGLHGHSWGGYETAFIVTQTNAFKCAIAGAPLTNLVSMYNSIYWNTGSANQPLFESGQGRFTGGYWDNPEVYLRNSPVFHARNVQTPLLLVHNDRDGAVDWHQSIEYFNALRRLQKPVILLQYKGENHTLTKQANKKDYAVRMREFFDHHLLGKPAPDWLKEGIPHLKLDELLQNR
jgi:dipeptidyl aminopeptidase/acylaminoacyl peptidase